MPDPVKKEKVASNKKSALETKLFWSQKDPVWATISSKEQKVVFQIAEKYKAFINRSRSERLAVQEIIRLAQQQGFHLVNDTKLEPNKDQLIFVEGGKTLALVKLGKQSVTHGLRLIVSHLDKLPYLTLRFIKNTLIATISPIAIVPITTIAGDIDKQNNPGSDVFIRSA